MKKIEWENYQDGDSTPLNAENLNLMQDNIEEALDNIDITDQLALKADKKDYVQTDDEYGSVGIGELPKQEDNSLTVKGNIYAKNLEWTRITTALNQSTGTITLTDDITKYSEMLIQTGYTSTNTVWTDISYGTNNNNFNVGHTVNCKTYGGIFSVTITNETTLTITKADNGVRYIWAK